MIQLSFEGVEARINEGEWWAADPKLAELLNAEEKLWRQDKTTYDPDPDMSSAQHAVKKFGAEITSIAAHEDPTDGEERVY